MTDYEKSLILQKLKENYEEALNRVEQKEGKELEDFKQRIVDEGCYHPDTRSWTEDCDDGYGRWWKIRITECTLCLKRLKVDYNA